MISPWVKSKKKKNQQQNFYYFHFLRRLRLRGTPCIIFSPVRSNSIILKSHPFFFSMSFIHRILVYYRHIINTTVYDNFRYRSTLSTFGQSGRFFYFFYYYFINRYCGPNDILKSFLTFSSLYIYIYKKRYLFYLHRVIISFRTYRAVNLFILNPYPILLLYTGPFYWREDIAGPGPMRIRIPPPYWI